ncbi:hypothetical protein A0H81_04431 [Grifola frondosa]|uniref:Uncharacterized protein n=1 Tax=Grifola frondosa TaxID=5627 RepID=A0A1C7ME77_GRIFR|nr:hypothetical protein A0H81_04431 [Grifola frondosa]
MLHARRAPEIREATLIRAPSTASRDHSWQPALPTCNTTITSACGLGTSSGAPIYPSRMMAHSRDMPATLSLIQMRLLCAAAGD